MTTPTDEFSSAFSTAFDPLAASPGDGPICSWPVEYTACGPCDDLTSLPASGVAMFEEMAAEYLWRWTGEQFGICETTIRPCRQDCTEGLSTYGRPPSSSIGLTGSPWQPVLLSGQWYNIGCSGGCGDNCGCTSGRALVFEKPIYGVSEIVIDGVVLDPSAYRVDDSRYLVRMDGKLWPYCQNMTRPAGQPNTWTVTVQTGAPVPIGGQIAAGKLTCELAKAACGAKDCELPQRWQTITRQGVTISAAIDLFEGLDQGKTGIWLIDSWVASVMRPDPGFSLASPDYRSVGRRTTFGG